MKPTLIVLLLACTTTLFTNVTSSGLCTTSDDCPPSSVCTYTEPGNAPVKMCVLKDKKAKIIAFKASNVTNLTPLAGDTLVFPNIILNEGESYDSGTGVFTAPCSGLYFFTMQMAIVPNSRIATSIMMQETEVGRAYTRDVNTYTVSGSDGVAMMTQGDRAFIKVIARNGTLIECPKMMNSFSGFLVHEI